MHLFLHCKVAKELRDRFFMCLLLFSCICKCPMLSLGDKSTIRSYGDVLFWQSIGCFDWSGMIGLSIRELVARLHGSMTLVPSSVSPMFSVRETVGSAKKRR